MSALKRLHLTGWKSIRDCSLDLDDLNVVIGANGSGKSNLISFFKFLNVMIPEKLQDYIGKSGGAQSLLHFGAKTTPFAEASLEFETDTNNENRYFMRLAHAAVDTLIFTEERLEWQHLPPDVLGAGHRETLLNQAASEGNKTAKTLRFLISRCRVFHFHDTSDSANVRQNGLIDTNRHLAPDAGNLAAMLYLYQETRPPIYQRIVGAVRQIAPFVEDFALAPRRLNPREIALNWRAKGHSYEFGPHQLSDGTLRAIALVTLLLQPEEDLPALIVLDEPELGLHPFAIGVLAGLMRKAAHHCQLLIATQSTTLLDHFDPEQVIVASQQTGVTEFRRLDPISLDEWLAEYSLSELWEKNVLGGGPY